MPMTPQKIIKIKTVDGETVHIRVYARGIIVERGAETCAYMAGVRVPDWLVEKAPSEIDSRELFRLKSPELICRFIIKAGPRRVMSSLKGRVVDRDGSYRLIVFDDSGKKRTYLRRGWHSDSWRLDEVDPSIRTVSQAFIWQRMKEEQKKQEERRWRGLH